jgi:thiamine biosynthesis lipoprotein ApbE
MRATMLPSARPAPLATGLPAAPAAARSATTATAWPVTSATTRPPTSATAWPGPAVAEWPALGTLAVLAVTDPMALPAARELLTAQLAAVDAACSTFRDDSELVAVNAAARQDGPVRVSPLLAEAIGAALRAAEQTGGDVDPVAGPRISLAPGIRAITSAQRAGTYMQPAGASLRLVITAAANWRQVCLDEENGLLDLPSGTWLDLGATAKAWAADRAAASIAARLDCGVLISLGGDLAAYGEPPHGGWRIRVQDKAGPAAGRPAVQPAGSATLVSIDSGGLATAGASAVRWRHGGDVLQHILRPRDDGPAVPGWRTVSVTAASCAEASAASTAAIIRGSQAIGWLSGLGLPARLVDTAGRVRTVAGWPAGDAPAGDGPARTSRRTMAAHGISAGRTGRTYAGGKAGQQ